MKDVVGMYVFMMMMLALITDDTKVVLYAPRTSKLSVRTRVLPHWYTSEHSARVAAKGGDIVRAHITVGMLVGHTMVYVPNMGCGVTLLHGARRYAQRSSVCV